MKAVKKMGPGPGNVQLVDVPEPKPAPNQVKIKIAYCGICGTDTHIVNWSTPVDVPLILGHEFAGTIAEVGSEVSRFSQGDRVVAIPLSGICGKCEACMMGDFANCPSAKFPGYIKMDGGMAEYMVIDETSVIPLPRYIPLKHAAVMEPACVAAHAVYEKANICPGDTVVITGPGPIGLLAVQFAKLRGATVIITGRERNLKRLELAEQLGADQFILIDRCNPVEEIMMMTDNKGVDYVFECSGTDDAMSMGIAMLKPRGTMVVVGLTNANGSTLPSFPLAIYRELEIRGAFAYSVATWPRVLTLLAMGKLNFEAIITPEYSLEEFETALTSKEKIKGVFKISGEE